MTYQWYLLVRKYGTNGFVKEKFKKKRWNPNGKKVSGLDITEALMKQ